MHNKTIIIYSHKEENSTEVTQTKDTSFTCFSYKNLLAQLHIRIY